MLKLADRVQGVRILHRCKVGESVDAESLLIEFRWLDLEPVQD